MTRILPSLLWVANGRLPYEPTKTHLRPLKILDYTCLSSPMRNIAMLQSIVNQLNAAESQARIEALYTLAMVEETEALPLLTSLWSRETDAEVKKVLNWAGAQINAARKRGYSTIEAMVEAYRIAPVGGQQTPGTTSDDKQTTEEAFLRKMAGDIEAQRRLEQIQREYGATD